MLILFDTPEARGFEETTETIAPCGGFNYTTTYYNFPQTGGSVSFSILDEHGEVNAYFSTGANTTNFVAIDGAGWSVTADGGGAYTKTVSLPSGVAVGTKGVKTKTKQYFFYAIFFKTKIRFCN